MTFGGLSVQEGFPPLELANDISMALGHAPVNKKVNNLTDALLDV